MSTQVITAFDQDPEYEKIIIVNRSNFTIEDWVATLSVEEQQEWRRQHDIHEKTVYAAVEAGDAEVVNRHSMNSAVKWKSQEIHLKWMNTISAEDNQSYHSFWDRYHAAMAERNQQ
jgi:hypothetical protein